MEDATLYSQWHFWLIVTGIIVVAAAVLLILVIAQARRILRLAGAALGIVTEIKENTMCIWELQDTNKVALGILDQTEKIKAHTELVATSLPQNDN